ncbi:hypothetical protein NVP1198A_15 [Vibrio phage 1.198.A._10N.286.54.F4]|nr:hypothetical protein NVP1198A_15 [Vibrio phage 1.198.A._10N.286.54.F4]
MSNKVGSYINPLQEVQLSEHEKWTDKACNINELMQVVGKPDDLPLGVSIVWYALDRLHEDLKHKEQLTKWG